MREFRRKMFYLLILRMVAKQQPHFFQQTINVKKPLVVLFDVYEQMITDGVMNWGRFFVFIRYAECFNLQRQQWNMLLAFIESKHPLALPSLWTLIACLFIDMTS